MFQIINHFPEVLKGIQLLGRRFFQPIIEVELVRFIQWDDSDCFAHQVQTIKTAVFFQLQQILNEMPRAWAEA
jgi:hypothetical protein